MYNPYNFYNPNIFNAYDPNYVKNLEEKIKVLENNNRKMGDPLLAEFQNSAEYQQAKRDNFLTFLLENSLPQWQNSNLGKKFAEWEKSAFDKFRESKNKL